MVHIYRYHDLLITTDRKRIDIYFTMVVIQPKNWKLILPHLFRDGGSIYIGTNAFNEHTQNNNNIPGI